MSRSVALVALAAPWIVACSDSQGVSQKLELVPTGLDCKVIEVLQDHCVTCHGSPPIRGAPMPLVTYDDLAAPSQSDPNHLVGQVALARMTDAEHPMPPPPADPVDGDHYAVFDSWVDAGMPRGSCAPPPSSTGHTM